MGQKISVVIPNYNGLKLLKENLSKVISATKKYDPESEFIMVDDASTDRSVTYVKKQFPEIKIIKLKFNRGFASAVNMGLKYVKCEYIVYLIRMLNRLIIT